jgi:uncharacterized phage protein (TIGR01671 family)
MREILFRGKRVDNGEWAYGDLLTCDDEMEIYSESHGENGGWVIPETVGEYIGLTDKNGVKIFEGDILESFYKKKRVVSVVKYGAFEPEFFYECAEAQGFFLFGMKLYGLYAYDLTGSEMMLVEDMRQAKIIGNIHDNPEILGGDDHAAD